MNKNGFPLFMDLVISLAAVASIRGQADDLAIIKSRLVDDARNAHGFMVRTIRFSPTDMSKAPDYLRQISPDGSWADIDYEDRDNEWSPIQRLDRMLVLNLAFSGPDTALYQSTECLEAVEQALAYWYRVNPACVNWYKNDIMKQMYPGEIALLPGERLNPSVFARKIEDLTPGQSGRLRRILEREPDTVSTMPVLSSDHASLQTGCRPQHFHLIR